jgi:hypothetical protein
LKCVDTVRLANECILERHWPALETTTPPTIIISILTNYTINTINAINHYRIHRIVRRRMAFDARQNQTLTYGHAFRTRLELLPGST